MALFFAGHVFGPGRAGLLAAQLPATDAAATADRDARAAALAAKLRQLDTAQNAQILALEQLSADPADPGDTAAAAMRGRITARFAELHADREQAEAQLSALAAATPKAADTTLLEELPLAGDILPGLPADLKARLFDAFDLQILWNKPGQQATVFAEITEATLRALPGILDPGRDGYDDTAEGANGEPAFGEDLFEAPMVHKILPEAQILPSTLGAARRGVFCEGELKLVVKVTLEAGHVGIREKRVARGSGLMGKLTGGRCWRSCRGL